MKRAYLKPKLILTLFAVIYIGASLIKNFLKSYSNGWPRNAIKVWEGKQNNKKVIFVQVFNMEDHDIEIDSIGYIAKDDSKITGPIQFKGLLKGLYHTSAIYWDKEDLIQKAKNPLTVWVKDSQNNVHYSRPRELY